MIKYIQQEEIDRSKWDICVDEAFNGLVYAKSWYLDIVAGEWDALVENDYEKIFPLVYREKWGIPYLYQPVFTQQLGLFSRTLLTEKSMIEFLEAIPKKFKFAEINLNTFNKLAVGINSTSPANNSVAKKSFCLEKGKIKTTNWLTHELDLINSYEHIEKNYSSNLKRNLKKSKSTGLVITKNIKPDDIISLFRSNRGRTISNLQENDYLKLSRLTYSGIYKGVTSTYGVFDSNNTLCAGAIFLQSKKKVIFLFSGLNEQGKKSGAMAFLIDSFIREKQLMHLTLDFEGSNDPNLARFYKSFGSTMIHYPHIYFNKLNPILKPIISLVKKFRS